MRHDIVRRGVVGHDVVGTEVVEHGVVEHGVVGSGVDKSAVRYLHLLMVSLAAGGHNTTIPAVSAIMQLVSESKEPEEPIDTSNPAGANTS